ncbi:MAG: Hsp20/alpha crystallin family protein [Deltaproteobacteria bacterium]|nr:Hsp20/alpha crystallin family protein [Deltaproteobacteria bacterium]
MRILVGSGWEIDSPSLGMHHLAGWVLREKSALMSAYDGAWRPSIDVFESEESILVIVELAGVNRDEMTIEHEGELLRIAGRRRDPHTLYRAGLKRCHQMEIDYGPFERVIRVTAPVDRERIEAVHENGFLKIILPKKEKDLARRIDIL